MATRPQPRLTIPRLGPRDLKYIPGAPGFTALAAKHLGNAGTSKDGFDALLHAVTRSAAADSGIGRLSDVDLRGAAFVRGAFSKANYAPLATVIHKFQSDGDKANADVANFIAGTSTPSGSSGTGGGKGTGGGSTGGGGGGGQGDGDSGGGDEGGGCDVISGRNCTFK